MEIKILAVSSTGGHWIQLRRLENFFLQYNTVYICTSKKDVGKNKFYKVIEASRWNKVQLLTQFVKVYKIFVIEKPDMIISTGASVGIWAIFMGFLNKKTTIWIDSIANYNKISLSGKIVKPFCTYFLTQWPHLSKSKILYKGDVL